MTRIASITINRDTTAANQATLKQMSSWQLQLADGKRIHKPSDDPIGIRQQLQLKAHSLNVDSLVGNIDRSIGFGNASDTAFAGMTDLLQQTKSLAVQGGNDTNTPQSRAALGEEVDRLLDRMIDLGNTQYDGRFIFSGTATTTKPFALDAASGQVLYQGTNDAFSVEITTVSRAQVSLDGSAFTQRPQDVFATLIALRDALRADDGASVRNLIGDIDSAHGQITDAFGDLGGRQARLEATKNQLLDVQLNLDEQISILGDADLTEVISKFKQAEVALQAGLQAGARVMQTSLLDYLQ